MTGIDYLKDGISSVSLVDKMEVDTPLKVVNAARQSYNKNKDTFDEKDKKLVKFLWDHEHTSPFRHSYFTFHITLPIAIARQLMKYQVGSGFRTYEVDGKEVSLEVFDHFLDDDKGCSWNEASGRYTLTSDKFYFPKTLRSNPPHGNKQSSEDYVNPLDKYDVKHINQTDIQYNVEDALHFALTLYQLLIDNGVAKEIARLILPQGMYTEAYWTVSLQSVLHFLHQRLSPTAQYEIRMLAEAIYDLMKDTLDRLGITKESLIGA